MCQSVCVCVCQSAMSTPSKEIHKIFKKFHFLFLSEIPMYINIQVFIFLIVGENSIREFFFSELISQIIQNCK